MNTKIRKILILRFRRVGDSVISAVLCSSLKKTFPDAEIHYVLNESIAPLFLHHPDIDRIIPFSEGEMKHTLRYLRKVIKTVKENHYDIIIDTRSTIRTLLFSLLSPGTPFRIGRKKRYNLLIQNYRVDNRYDGSCDEVGSTLKLLSPLEKKFDVQYDRNFRLHVTGREKLDFRIYMEQQGIDPTKRVIICAVTARLKNKVWDKDKMKEILTRLIKKYDVQLVFNYGGKEEKDFAIQLYEEMGEEKPRVFVNIEAKGLRELAAMFANSDFFFGNEGGPRHISQAFDVPSFAIYPPNTPKGEWLPNSSERFQGIQPSDVTEEANDPNLSFTEKFNLISTDEVWKKLDEMMKEL